jgi:hypothetical protein
MNEAIDASASTQPLVRLSSCVVIGLSILKRANGRATGCHGIASKTDGVFKRIPLKKIL